MAELRVLVVDDEPLVREGIRVLLEREVGVRLLGEARNGEEALERIRELRPDLVLLDVQMPGMDGFAVVAALDPGERPAIVFVTAHSEYAIQAFEVHAVDYLLKPFDAERFATALSRARVRMAAGNADRLEELLATLRPAHAYPERLLLKHEGTVVVVLANDIDWVEAADNYVKVHARTGRYMVREPLKQIETKLDPARFARVHRSAIVNLSRVKSLDPLTAGENIITLTTGTRLTLSRGFRDDFRSRLESARR
jgi:two-component system, LytTR family, response regulator